MHVVILVVGPTASKLDGALSLRKMSQEVMIEELRSVIPIEAEQGKGRIFSDLFDLFEDGGFVFSPDGSLFTLARGNVNAVNGISEHCGQRLVAMSDRVGFQETGARFVPLVGFDGDMFF